MSNRRTISLALSLGIFTLSAIAATERTTAPETEPANANGDVPFTGDRRPGILEEPSDIPTGENAHLYDFLRDSLEEDSVAEAPSEEPPLKPALVDET
jgi:hypothetical protein